MHFFHFLVWEISSRLQPLDVAEDFEGGAYFQSQVAQDVLAVKEQKSPTVNVLEGKK